MNKKIYILWNTVQNRPAIRCDSFGMLVASLTLEQAQAFQSKTGDSKQEDYVIKEFILNPSPDAKT